MWVSKNVMWVGKRWTDFYVTSMNFWMQIYAAWTNELLTEMSKHSSRGAKKGHIRVVWAAERFRPKLPSNIFSMSKNTGKRGSHGILSSNS